MAFVMSAFDAVDGSSTGTGVPWMWVPITCGGLAPVTSAGMLRDISKDIGHDNVSASLPAKNGLRARPS
jgi:hypothetical protein